MSEPVSVAAIVISAVTAIGGVLTALHIRKLHSGCMDCDCMPSSSISRSPTVSQPIVLQPIKISESDNGQTINEGSKNCQS